MHGVAHVAQAEEHTQQGHAVGSAAYADQQTVFITEKIVLSDKALDVLFEIFHAAKIRIFSEK